MEKGFLIQLIVWIFMGVCGLLTGVAMGIKEFTKLPFPPHFFKLFEVDPPSWWQASQAFVCLGLIALILAFLMSAIPLVKKDFSKKTTVLLQGILLFVGGGLLILAVIIFGAECSKSSRILPCEPYIGFGLIVVSGVGLLVAGGLSVLHYCRFE